VFKSRLTQLFSRGIARAASETGALIIDGGTKSGVMGLMGQGVAEREHKSILLGIAPARTVTYPTGPAEGSIPDGAPLDPNHSHFVLVDTERWGGETDTMFELAKALQELTPLKPVEPERTAWQRFTDWLKEKLGRQPAGASKPKANVPIVMVLVHGGPIARNEVLRAVRRGWPVVVIEGSGDLADEIAGHLKQKPAFILDPVLAEIIADGNLHLLDKDEPVEAFAQLLTRQLSETATLELAWQRFALYDANAARHQKEFDRLQVWILRLGVYTTGLVLIQTTFQRPDVADFCARALVQASWWPTETANFFARIWIWLCSILAYGAMGGLFWMDPVRRVIIIALPIITSVLLGASTRFDEGGKWVLLRSSAEAIKREIFRYRVQPVSRRDQPPSQMASGPSSAVPGPDQPAEPTASGQPSAPATSNQPARQMSAEAQLAQKLEFISRQVMQTRVNVSALRPYKGSTPPKYGAAEMDDGFSFLTPERYIKMRLGDQLGFYQGRTVGLEKQLKRWQWAILIVGGVGTLLAAVGLELWVALTTALVVAFTAYLQYRQVEGTLTQYNQAATNLANVQTWWMALSGEEQAKQENVELLVDHTEKTLESELTGWVQQMQDVLVELRDQQSKQLAELTEQQEKELAELRERQKKDQAELSKLRNKLETARKTSALPQPPSLPTPPAGNRPSGGA